MPLFNNEAADDPPVFDACGDFNGGQVSTGAPDQLAANQFAGAVNIDIAGRYPVTRRGTIALSGAAVVADTRVQGLAWYDTPDFEYLVACIDGELYKWDESAWTQISAYAAADTTRQVCFAQLVDTLFIADGGSNLFSWDNTTLTDEDIGAGNPPAGISFLITHTNRLFAAGVADAPDTLYVSAILDGSTWAGSGQSAGESGSIRIGGGEGDPITGLASLDNFQLVVFKRNSIYIVAAEPTNGLAYWDVTQISSTIGCVSHRSIVQVGADIWFLSDSGIRSIRRTLATTQREVDEPISEPIQDIIDRVNWDQADKAAAVFWGNRVMLSLPLEDSDEPDTVVVFNTLRQAWSGIWTGWSPLCWAPSRAGGSQRLNFGRADGFVYRWQDFVLPGNDAESAYQDGVGSGGSGELVPTELTTRAMIFSEAVCSKSGFHCEFEFFNSEAAADLELILDEDSAVTLKAAVATGPAPLLLPFNLPATLPTAGTVRRSYSLQHLEPFRSLQAKIRTERDRLSVRSIIASGFVNTMEIEE